MMRRSLMFVLGLVVLSPLFGVILADKVGYHEPLDIAAEKLGLNENEHISLPSLFPDYTVPGLDPVTGYIVSGFIGVGIILVLGTLLGKLVSKKRG